MCLLVTRTLGQGREIRERTEGCLASVALWRGTYLYGHYARGFALLRRGMVLGTGRWRWRVHGVPVG